MKKSIKSISVGFMILLLMSCAKDDVVSEHNDLATLSFGTLMNDLAAKNGDLKQQLGGAPACSDDTPAFVEVVLSGPTDVGTMQDPLVVQVNPTPGNYDGDPEAEYFTQEADELKLQPGNYTLQFFAVYNGHPNAPESKRIWIAPMEGGSFADFVENPLPLDISLGAGVKKYVDVEVLCFDDRVVNEYGYLFFDIIGTEAIEFCVFGNFCDETGRHFAASFSVDVWMFSGDIENPKGQLIHTNLANTTGTNNDGDVFAEPLCFALPDKEGEDQYYLEITLLDGEGYQVEPEVVRRGVFTDEDVRALHNEDESLEYYHFRTGACSEGDSPDLFLEEGVADNIIQLPPGFSIKKIADGLHLPSSLTWDDEGIMYVAEAGGGLFPQQLAPMRIVQINPNGTQVEVANLSNRGIDPAIVGLTWHDGWFYFTHRADDLTGALSRVDKNGNLELVFKGIIDSQAEHQINDVQVGPDGLMYVAVGPAGNAGVMGPSVAPWIMKSPQVHTTPCEDIVLIGKNFQTPNFLTSEEGDMVKTGAYVPFGVQTVPGQVIEGVTLCGGSILKFDPNNALGTIQTHAWGFRNIIGLAWDSKGNMFAGENGYDIRGSRPVQDVLDASLKINAGMWYGVPDFSAGREPLTDPKFEVPDSLQAPIYILDEFIGKNLGFVIDHEASGLTPPDPSVVLGRHEFNSSPSMLDAAPASWGIYADDIFIAEWGDLAPPTNPLRGNNPAGFRVVRVDPETSELEIFITNIGGGPASGQGKEGKGLDRPFDVKFGPDGAMYIVDYGIVTIDYSKAPPYAYRENTGAIWKVTKEE